MLKLVNMLEPVDRLKGFNLRPDTYSYILVSGTIRVTIPFSEPSSPTESRVKNSAGIGADDTTYLQDSPFFNNGNKVSFDDPAQVMTLEKP